MQKQFILKITSSSSIPKPLKFKLALFNTTNRIEIKNVPSENDHQNEKNRINLLIQLFLTIMGGGNNTTSTQHSSVGAPTHIQYLPSIFNLSNDVFNLSRDDFENFMNNLTSLKAHAIEGNGASDMASSSSASSTGVTRPLYCSSIYLDYADDYKRNFHGYFSMIICIFGTMANLANMAVLTRKDMVGAPINRVLTGLAFADMLVMVEYIPFVYYHNFIFQSRRDFTYLGALFILFHMNFSNILHTISICLTIALATWRYIAIRYPHMNHILCSDRRCTHAITASYLLPVFLCIPYYVTFNVTSKQIIENNENVTLYIVDISDLARKNDDQLFIASFWLYSVIFKLLPCCILTVISFYLIKALYKAKQRKQILRTGYDLNAHDAKAALSFIEKKGPSKSERRADRTTRMLVAVLLLFLITELPQGIMGLLSVLLGKEFFVSCYNKFGEIMDVLALLNGAINFILYCCMSRQFRTTFGNMFKPKLSRWTTNFTSTQQIAQQTSVQNTFV